MSARGRGRLRLPLAGALALLAAVAPAAAQAAVAAHDVSEQAGIADFAHTYGATVADFDSNGWQDAFIVRHYDSFPRYMLNGGGTFSDATAIAFPTAPPRRDYHDCPAADVNRDGHLDVYCTLGGRKGGNGPNRNELWLQWPSETFSEHARDWGVGDPFGRGRQATFLHANRDRLPDLYVTNQYPRLDGKRGPNQLFLNVAGERFRRAPGFGLNRQLGGLAVQAVDYDRDGDEDVLLCSQRGVRLFANVAGRRFRNVTRRAGAAGSCVDAQLERINRDARPDLVLIRRGRVVVHFQGRRGRFLRKPAYRRKAGGARELGLGDVNGDRRLDLYVLRAARYRPSRGADGQLDRPDLMLRSVRGGRSFRRMRIPQVRRGIGEAVEPIDYDRNGLTDFIVMNGRLKARGPIRLIAFERSG